MLQHCSQNNNIFIKFLTGKTLKFCLPDECSVDDLKGLISEEVGILPEQQDLYYGLGDTNTDTVHCIFRAWGCAPKCRNVRNSAEARAELRTSQLAAEAGNYRRALAGSLLCVEAIQGEQSELTRLHCQATTQTLSLLNAKTVRKLRRDDIRAQKALLKDEARAEKRQKRPRSVSSSTSKCPEEEAPVPPTPLCASSPAQGSNSGSNSDRGGGSDNDSDRMGGPASSTAEEEAAAVAEEAAAVAAEAAAAGDAADSAGDAAPASNAAPAAAEGDGGESGGTLADLAGESAGDVAAGPAGQSAGPARQTAASASSASGTAAAPARREQLKKTSLSSSSSSDSE